MVQHNVLSTLLLASVLVGCSGAPTTALPFGCPDDAPCFVRVVAPVGVVTSPGPFRILAEVVGPARIEGVGLVVSVNGREEVRYDMARAVDSRRIWEIPEVTDTSSEPESALETARVFAELKNGDEVRYILWAWDQTGASTNWASGSDTVEQNFVIEGPGFDGGPGDVDAGGAGRDGGPILDAGPSDIAVALDVG